MNGDGLVDLVLKIQKLSKSFGGLVALDSFNLELKKKTIHGIIGPNGAGKTTIFNLITGIYRANEGHIWFGGEEITTSSADFIARRGIARTFQNIRLFQKMTVLDNVRMAFHPHLECNLLETLLRLKAFHRSEEKINLESMEVLNYFDLGKRRNDLAQTLSYGEQRRLEMARALATGAKLLLLDEPAAGINHNEVDQLMELIRKIHNDFEISILLIEHQMPLVMGLCDSLQVVHFGTTIAEGSPTKVIESAEVVRAYLGDEEIVQ